MDFWTAYLTLALAYAGALGALVKGTPELYEALRPVFTTLMNYLWPTVGGISMGAFVVEANIRSAIDFAAVKDFAALNQATPFVMKAWLILLTYSAGVVLANAAHQFLTRVADEKRATRDGANKSPPADPETGA